MEVAVVLKSLAGAIEALRLTYGKTEVARQHAAEVRDAKKLLGLADPAAEAYRSDSRHPQFTADELHPDNMAALLAAGSDLLARSVIQRDSLATDASTSSLLLFGSPISDGLSRNIFGYSELPDREGLVLDNRQFDLRYAWELDPEQLGTGKVRRFVAGRGLVERPPWQIKDLRRESSLSRLVPQTDSNGLLHEDYLLVTRVPNFLSSDAESTGQFFVSFGGTHGTGTRAVSLLFGDRKLLREVVGQLKEKTRATTGRLGGIPRAYQLLFRVSNIKHTPRESIPRALELVDVFIIDDDTGAWNAAGRRLRL